ncbi:hypothetical protein Tco_0096819 [Tanacetum coccineum]
MSDTRKLVERKNECSIDVVQDFSAVAASTLLEQEILEMIAWYKVLLSSEFGGLNIGCLKAFNWSLLAKWWWRFKTKKNSLWKKVVCSFHGSDGNFGVASDVGSPGAWGKIVSIWNELEKIDISFLSSFHKKIGSSHDTRFWMEI